MAALAATNPRAIGVLHAMIFNMQRNNALVTSHATLAKVAKCSVSTVQRAIKTLKERGWIQVLQIGPSATVSAYVINDRVVWMGKREGIRYSLFSADILVSSAEQPDTRETENNAPLLKIPAMPDFRRTGEQIDAIDYIAEEQAKGKTGDAEL
jgi:DNA-binding transcriptional MocR family regulator